MSDSKNAGFGNHIPGFDFLQNLVKGATPATAQMPNPAHWIAPTLNVEELDKRIAELKAVHFWLEQNAKALAATVQALEVQKMTLATLKGMNFNMDGLANAFTGKAADAAEMAAKAGTATEPVTATAAGLIDPVKLWGALTQQFGQIAASAMKDAGISSTAGAVKNRATGSGSGAAKSTKNAAAQNAPKTAARKTSARSR